MARSPSVPTRFPDFAADYAGARSRFLRLAQRVGARIESWPIAARGPAGDALHIDSAYLGADQPRRLLVVLSGTHGVEGFAGSAMQSHWLDRFHRSRLPVDGGVLLIHAVNPYGFAWLRRTNENNVDLNRNALEHFPGPANPIYRSLDTWLNPTTPADIWDPLLRRGVPLLLRHGLATLRQVIVEGQYEFPRGLYYGGARLEPSVEIVLALLARPAWRDMTRAVILDLHTGVGRYADYTLMVDFPPTSQPYRQLQQWFGEDAVASNQPAASIAYRVNGALTTRIAEVLGPARTYAGVLEFGTYSGIRVLAGLRRENRVFHYAPSQSTGRRRAGVSLREIFCPSSPAWRSRVLDRAARFIQQAEAACFGKP
ncbi:MAG: DUF2817 domain-containing protein [Sulfurifustaceae bacterium]